MRIDLPWPGELRLEQAELGALGILVAALALGFVLHLIAFRVLRRVLPPAEVPVVAEVLRLGAAPLRWLLPLLLAYLVLPAVRPELPGGLGRWLETLLGLGLPVLFGWVLVAAIQVAEKVALSRLDLDSRDNLGARKLYTQIRVLKRIALVVVVVVTLAVVLMSYPRLRQLGAGLLASAGIAGIIVGFAAQRALGNLLAGFQIATSQPVRIDDVVVVEGEWGRVEEITLTYVVIRVWDLRRLVVPISYFIERPFQNWTRSSSELLGTVHLHVDYTVPVAAVRQELHRILHASEHWDGRVWNLQVTGAGDRTVELRATVSAADSGAAWELRCEVRENLIEYLQRHHPEALPRFRVETGHDSGSDPGRRGPVELGPTSPEEPASGGGGSGGREPAGDSERR